MNKADNAEIDGNSTGSNNTRRRFLQAAGATAAMSTMAGCIPDSGSQESPEAPINIVHLAPLSNNPLGTGSQRTANMFRDEFQGDGGINGEEFEINHVNTELDPAVATNEVDRLIEEDAADLFVGTYASEVSQAIMDSVANASIPFIVTGSAAPSTVTNFIGDDYDQYKNFFRTGPINSDFQAEAMLTYADHLNDLHGWNTFGIYADDATWTDPFMNTLPDGLQEAGYNVEFQEEISIDTTNLEPFAEDAEDAGVDAVIRFWAHIDGGNFLESRLVNDHTYGIEGVHVTGMFPQYYGAVDPAQACLYETTSQSGAGGAAPITEKTQPFVGEYQQRFADADPTTPILHPMYMGFNTYDALHMYKTAIEEAGTWDYVNDLDAIVDGMLSTSYTGVVGEIDLFGSDGDYPHDAIPARGGDSDTITNFPITQWQPDDSEIGIGLKCVYPEQHATEDHMATRWQ